MSLYICFQATKSTPSVVLCSRDCTESLSTGFMGPWTPQDDAHPCMNRGESLGTQNNSMRLIDKT